MLNDLIKTKEVREIKILSICAMYAGHDSNYDYWLGINDILYKIER